MARIAGVDLPREKRIEIGLTYVYGIGRSTSNKILAEAGVNPDTRVRNVTDDEVKKITEPHESCRSPSGPLQTVIIPASAYVSDSRRSL